LLLPSKCLQPVKWADKYLIYEFTSFSILNCYGKHYIMLTG
jgi:hypothetical protein